MKSHISFKKFIVVFLLFFCLSINLAQQPIDVTESTLKIKGMSEEIFYFGFAEGDQMVFNFNEVNAKELKEIEVIELPSSTKFMDYKTKKVENKTILVSRTGIYKFRFFNSALLGRVCKFKIQRIPINNTTANFNTTVYTKSVNDTTKTIEEEKYLIRSDTLISNFVDQVSKVHSASNMNGNKTTFNFKLPENTISWSYYIGVDQGGQKAFQDASLQFAKKAGPSIAKMQGYGAMAALALYGISYFSILQSGEDVNYYFVNSENVNLFSSGQQFYYIKKGFVVNDFSRMEAPLKGEYFVCLLNDNALTGIEVTIKLTAIVVNQKWGVRPIEKISTSSREVMYLKD
jgi:hypothetical protein